MTCERKKNKDADLKAKKNVTFEDRVIKTDTKVTKETELSVHFHSSDVRSSTGRARLIRSHSSARFCFELSGNSN